MQRAAIRNRYLPICKKYRAMPNSTTNVRPTEAFFFRKKKVRLPENRTTTKFQKKNRNADDALFRQIE